MSAGRAAHIRLLARIGLDRPELRAWAMYDWANSAFQTTIITAVFPRFFSDYAAAGLDPTDATARFAWATTIAVTITALIGPVLGAIADIRGMKKTLLGVSMSVGIVATVLMATIFGILIGVFVFLEPFDPKRGIGFALIWTGLLVYSSESLWKLRSARNAQPAVAEAAR